MTQFNESLIETTLSWFYELGYKTLSGPTIAPDEPKAERQSYDQVILEERLRNSLKHLNPNLPAEAVEEAFRKLTRTDAPTLVTHNHALHQMLVDGVNIEYRGKNGSIVGTQVRVIDFDNPDNNDWLVVNQITVTENKRHHRPDIVVFVNGLPLVVMELTKVSDENATIDSGIQQLQTLKNEIPSLFAFNAALVVSDGVQARIGTITSDRERFMAWRTMDKNEIEKPTVVELEILLKGVFDKRHFLDIVRHFIVFEEDEHKNKIKKIAGYHQFYAVNVAVEETLRAALGINTAGQHGGKLGDKRIGVVWHTQGSGKSLTMVFYAGKIILHPAMENPTIVVLTDRNDLDEQLSKTFSRCKNLLRQPPAPVTTRSELREKLKVDSGGVVFTTVQKFFPEEKGDRYPLLSNRRNIVVMADEAHRSQYDFIDGFARHMRDALPNASFIGFTGTPIELSDKNTRAVFGDYISIYDIQRAVQDKATVPIYYEGRLAKLALKESEKPKIDFEFEEATEGEEIIHKEKLKSKWAQLEALVGTEERLHLIAKDLVEHFEKRLTAMDGKAMVVCMSRRVCVQLYREIVALRPDWHHEDDAKGILKVVMTGSATDPIDWQPHIRNKKKREDLAERFRKPTEPFKIVIVRDMWLTGFDAPCLHTMYVDKPMREHGLMQAIARVNRVFGDKPGGLVVDYLGLADELRQALATYTESGGTGKTAIDQEEAVEAMLEKYEVCRGLFHGFDWSKWITGESAEKLSLLPLAQEHILAQKNGKERLLKAVTELSQAFALAVPHEETLRIRDDVEFFQNVRAVLAKKMSGNYQTDEGLHHTIRQIVSQAVFSGEVMDIFAAAGLKNPHISILSEEFLTEVRNLPQKNLAVELLRKLLSGEIQSRAKKNSVQARSFSELLEKSIRKYQNRAIETTQVIEELIALAKEMKQANARGETLGLSEDEIAFYDALEINDSAVKVLGEPTLKTIARELVETVKKNVTIDWTVRENVRAQLRVLVKRILRKHGYPPDKQEKATETVLQQAELLCADWAPI
jgi:type I restriction enzyme R subunit